MSTQSVYVLDDVAVIAGLFWLSQFIVLWLVLAPVGRFFAFGWAIRKQDFTNRLLGKPIDAYLKRFWTNTISRRKLAALDPDQQFSKVYDVIGGRQLYIVPAMLFALAVFIFGGLVIMTGLRVGYEMYIQLCLTFQKNEPHVFPGVVPHLSLLEINRAFYPFPPIALTFATLASVSGAYLYATQVVIGGYKDRTLLSSDLLWATFRLVIAIPLGMAVGTVGSDALAPLIGFGLGGFPISAINKLLRRLTSRALNQSEQADQDDLLKMLGVTPDISALLNEERVYSPQQLIDNDPVSMAVRTGLPFDFVVNLISQSQVWSFFGATAAKLGPYAYGDARMIKRVMDQIAAGNADAIASLQAVSQAVGIDEATLKVVFRAIAADPYTLFLDGISS